MPITKNYIHTQGIPESLWIITHNLNRFPAISGVYDSNNEEVEGDVQYISNNVVHITFSGAFSGSAILT